MQNISNLSFVSREKNFWLGPLDSFHTISGCRFRRGCTPQRINYILFIYHGLVKEGIRYMVFNVTFNNISVISWRSILLVEEI
jgi:hypothetical protein